MAYKNTILVKAPNKREFIFHFIERVTHIECQLYPHGDPTRAETLGYWHKRAAYMEPIGRPNEWQYARNIIHTIMRQSQGIKQLFWSHMHITSLGKMTIKQFKEIITNEMVDKR